jgi:RNA polymerase sigma factor (sigma-70 family)
LAEQVEECDVTIQSRAYRWSRKDGLDPEAVTALRPWIIKCAKPFLRRAADQHIEMADLMQAGAVGALQAARTYDPGRKKAFVTWATYSIRRGMHSLCAGAYTVPLDGRDEASEAEAPPLSLDVPRVLASLPRRDRELINQHFGLLTGRPLSLAAIAKERGQAAPTVGQRLNRALQKARQLMEVKGG